MQTKTKFRWKIIGITLLTAIVGSIFSEKSGEFYSTMVRPPLAPPAIVFPIVWTLLYILMALSIMVYGQKKGDLPVVFWLYVGNLALNAIWPLLFFSFHLLFVSVFVLLGMLAVNLILLRKLRESPLAFYLYLPYLLWQMFALYLNLSIYFLN